jgi:hypothetical protein
MASILDAPDYTCRLSSPFSSEVLELEVDGPLRRLLHDAGIAEADYDPMTIGHPPWSEEEPDPKQAFWTVDIQLGAVEAFRRTIHGQEDTREKTRLYLHTEIRGTEGIRCTRTVAGASCADRRGYFAAAVGTVRAPISSSSWRGSRRARVVGQYFGASSR